MDDQNPRLFSKALEIISQILNKQEWETKIQNMEIVQRYANEYFQSRDADENAFFKALTILLELPEEAQVLASKYEHPIRHQQKKLPSAFLEEMKAIFKSKRIQGKNLLIPPEPIEEDEEDDDLEWLIDEAATKADFWDEDGTNVIPQEFDCLNCGSDIQGKFVYFEYNTYSYNGPHHLTYTLLTSSYCHECANLESTPPCFKFGWSTYMFEQINKEVSNRLRRNQVLIDKNQIQVVDDLIPPDLHAKLVEELNYVALNSQHDFHPGSDRKVMNLIHPSMYPFIHGLSQCVPTEDPLIDPHPMNSIPTPSLSDTVHRRSLSRTSKYQWLPAEVTVDQEGLCEFTSYINNLYPEIYPNLYPLLGLVFTYFLPLFESCLARSLKGRKLQVVVKASDYILKPGQSYAGNWHLEGTPQEHIVASGIYYYDISEGIHDEGLGFRRQRDYRLDYPSHYHDNYLDWKYEIITRAIFEFQELEPPLGVTSTRLSFEDFFGGGDNIIDHPPPPELRFQHSIIPLGHIETKPNRCVVFSNELQHRVNGVHVPTSTKEVQKRRILCFFLVDPDHRIPSSKIVAPQQWVYRKEIFSYLSKIKVGDMHVPIEIIEKIMDLAIPRMTMKEALEHRLKLMYDRRIISNRENSEYEEEYSLCEH